MKTIIHFERRELVWEKYRVDYTEEDWNRLVEYASHRTEDPVWNARYQVIKDIDFNTLVEIIDGNAKDPWIIYEAEGRLYHEERLSSFLIGEMREDALSYGYIDVDYADDSEEDVTTY